MVVTCRVAIVPPCLTGESDGAGGRADPKRLFPHLQYFLDVDFFSLSVGCIPVRGGQPDPTSSS